MVVLVDLGIPRYPFSPQNAEISSSAVVIHILGFHNYRA
jgi:hypothetical protein